MSNLAKNRVHSTWTPLANHEVNQKPKDPESKPSKGPDPLRGIFEERKALVGKWFDKWTDSQRKEVLEELLGKCKASQLQFAIDVVSRKRPVFHADFTRSLPRVLSLYIFSYLDPRSLCRCAQVCWNWKYLTELDQLWMPKCCRLGWILSFSPSPYETGVWKRLYIENIMSLKCCTPKLPDGMSQIETSTSKMSLLAHIESNMKTPRQKNTRPPWKGSDPVPKDTWRNNYLENDDEIQKVSKLRKKGLYGSETSEILNKAKNKVNTGLRVIERPSSVRRSKSASNLRSSSQQRPDWALPGDQSHQLCKIDPRTAVSPVVLKGNKNLSSTRSARDPPTVDLFPAQPWKVPDEEEFDTEVY